MPTGACRRPGAARLAEAAGAPSPQPTSSYCCYGSLGLTISVSQRVFSEA
jgi:hypothetical protein|eukprot:COSAG01_NODE_5385_length_4293_cov_19.521221_1_plen_50_part_00